MLNSVSVPSKSSYDSNTLKCQIPCWLYICSDACPGSDYPRTSCLLPSMTGARGVYLCTVFTPYQVFTNIIPCKPRQHIPMNLLVLPGSGLDPGSMRSVDPEPDSSGSGIRIRIQEGKNDPQKLEKMFWSAECFFGRPLWRPRDK